MISKESIENIDLFTEEHYYGYRVIDISVEPCECYGRTVITIGKFNSPSSHKVFYFRPSDLAALKKRWGRMIEVEDGVSVIYATAQNKDRTSEAIGFNMIGVKGNWQWAD